MYNQINIEPKCPQCGALGCDMLYLSTTTGDCLGCNICCDETYELVSGEFEILCPNCGELGTMMLTRSCDGDAIACSNCYVEEDAYEYTLDRFADDKEYYSILLNPAMEDLL